MSAPSRALLYVAADRDGQPCLLAAIERGGDDGLDARLLPDAGRLSAHDLRGRRAPLGALLGAHDASSEAQLADVTAHLLPLPVLGAEPESRVVNLRLVGLDARTFAARWAAPGGGEFEVDASPLALPGQREGALLASKAAPGGPWLAPVDGASAELEALLRLIAEAGDLYHSRPLLDPWLTTPVEFGGAALAADEAAPVLDALRSLLRDALLGRTAGDAADDRGGRSEIRGVEMAVTVDADGPSLRWRIEVAVRDERHLLEVATARFSTEAVGDLLAVVGAHLEPYWLLVFDAVDDFGSTFVGVIELQRYLIENLDALEGPCR